MAKVNYTIVCDDIRLERGRKNSLMGVYTKEILVPTFPFLFPRLGLFQNITEVIDGEKFSISIRGDGLKGTTIEGTVTQEQSMKKNNKNSLIDANIVLNFNAIQIQRPGKLIFETSFSDGKTHNYEIEIKLATPEQLK